MPVTTLKTWRQLSAGLSVAGAYVQDCFWTHGFGILLDFDGVVQLTQGGF